jgi:hypothetical protein
MFYSKPNHRTRLKSHPKTTTNLHHRTTLTLTLNTTPHGPQLPYDHIKGSRESGSSHEYRIKSTIIDPSPRFNTIKRPKVASKTTTLTRTSLNKTTKIKNQTRSLTHFSSLRTDSTQKRSKIENEKSSAINNTQNTPPRTQSIDLHSDSIDATGKAGALSIDAGSNQLQYPTPSTKIGGGAKAGLKLSECGPQEWRILLQKGIKKSIPNITPVMFSLGLTPFAAPFSYTHSTPHQVDPGLWPDYELLADHSVIPPHYGIGSGLTFPRILRSILLRNYFAILFDKSKAIIRVINSPRFLHLTTDDKRQLLMAVSSLDNLLALTTIGFRTLQPIKAWNDDILKDFQGHGEEIVDKLNELLSTDGTGDNVEEDEREETDYSTIQTGPKTKGRKRSAQNADTLSDMNDHLDDLARLDSYIKADLLNPNTLPFSKESLTMLAPSKRVIGPDGAPVPAIVPRAARRLHRSVLGNILLYYQIPITSLFELLPPKLRFEREIKLGFRSSDSTYASFLLQNAQTWRQRAVHTFPFDKSQVDPESSSSSSSSSSAPKVKNFDPYQSGFDITDPRLYHLNHTTSTGIYSDLLSFDDAILRAQSKYSLLVTKCLGDVLGQYISKLYFDQIKTDFTPVYLQTIAENSLVPDLIQERIGLNNFSDDTMKSSIEHILGCRNIPQAAPLAVVNTKSAIKSTITTEAQNYLEPYLDIPDCLPSQLVFLHARKVGVSSQLGTVRKRPRKSGPNLVTERHIIQLAAVDGLGNEFSTYVNPGLPFEDFVQNSPHLGSIEKSWHPQAPTLDLALDSFMQWLYHPLSGRIPTTFIPHEDYHNPLVQLDRYPQIRSKVSAFSATELELAALPPMVRKIFYEHLSQSTTKASKVHYDFLTQELTTNGLNITLSEKPSQRIFKTQSLENKSGTTKLVFRATRFELEQIIMEQHRQRPKPLSGGKFSLKKHLGLTAAHAESTLSNFDSNSTTNQFFNQRLASFDGSGLVDRNIIEAEIIRVDDNGDIIESGKPSRQKLHPLYSSLHTSHLQHSRLTPSPLPPTMIISPGVDALMASLDEACRLIDYRDAQTNLLKPYNVNSYQDLSPDERFYSLPSTHRDYSPLSYRYGIFNSGLQFYDPMLNSRTMFSSELTNAGNSPQFTYWALTGLDNNGSNPNSLYQAHISRALFFMGGLQGAYWRAELHHAYNSAINHGAYYLNPKVRYPLSTFSNLNDHPDHLDQHDSKSCSFWDFSNYLKYSTMEPDQLKSIMNPSTKNTDFTSIALPPEDDSTKQSPPSQQNSSSAQTFYQNDKYPDITFQDGNVVWDFAQSDYRTQKLGEKGLLTEDNIPNIRGHILSSSIDFSKQLTPTALKAFETGIDTNGVLKEWNRIVSLIAVKSTRKSTSTKSALVDDLKYPHLAETNIIDDKHHPVDGDGVAEGLFLPGQSDWFYSPQALTTETGARLSDDALAKMHFFGAATKI